MALLAVSDHEDLVGCPKALQALPKTHAGQYVRNIRYIQLLYDENYIAATASVLGPF